MALIGSYKKKIKSAKNIAKITKAMQLVAASKMKKAQEAALSGKEYADGIQNISKAVSKYYDSKIGKLTEENRLNKKTLIIVLAPEKGLCGGLVTNLSKFLFNVVKNEKTSDFIVVGKKAKQVVKRFGGQVIADFELGVSSPSFEFVPPIARIIEERFSSGQCDKVKVVYSEFINTMEQTPKELTLLPLDIKDNESLESSTTDFKFEPSVEDVAKPLFEMYLEVELYQILLEAYASEQSARMVAMKSATDNAKSLIEDLTIEFNKVRQSAITNELLDIQNAVSIIQ